MINGKIKKKLPGIKTCFFRRNFMNIGDKKIKMLITFTFYKITFG